MNPQILIYGATGYTGKLTAEYARQQGMQPVLAGRSEAKVREVAEPLGFSWRVASLDDADSLDRALEGMQVVLHIAGPFSATSAPMVAACLRCGVHYLDITGEIDVFETLANRSDEARERGVMIMPGVGFDVVPTDCAAAWLKEQLPDATHLRLYIQGLENPSRGTAKTGWEMLGGLARLRRDGEIISLGAPHSRPMDFGQGAVECTTASWSDVSAAYYTTGIRNIEVLFKVIPGMKLGYFVSRYFGWFIRTGFIQSLVKLVLDKGNDGPDEAYRRTNKCVIVGEVVNQQGERRATRISTCNGYNFTALAALRIAEKVCRGSARPGFHTPGGLFGPDLVLEIPESVRTNLSQEA